jgi:hypothetical protein
MAGADGADEPDKWIIEINTNMRLERPKERRSSRFSLRRHFRRSSTEEEYVKPSEAMRVSDEGVTTYKYIYVTDLPTPSDKEDRQGQLGGDEDGPTDPDSNQTD